MLHTSHLTLEISQFTMSNVLCIPVCPSPSLSTACDVFPVMPSHSLELAFCLLLYKRCSAYCIYHTTYSVQCIGASHYVGHTEIMAVLVHYKVYLSLQCFLLKHSVPCSVHCVANVIFLWRMNIKIYLWPKDLLNIWQMNLFIYKYLKIICS